MAEHKPEIKHYKVKINKPLLLEKLNIDADDTNAIEIIDDLISQAEKIGRPKALLKKCRISLISGRNVTIDDICFESTIMTNNLKDNKSIIAYIVTCGTELDSWSLNKTDMLEQYWAKDVCEHVLGNAYSDLFKDAELIMEPGKSLSVMNPGSLEDWPLPEQKKLFTLLGNPENDIGVTLSESCLMYPIKSVSGIIFEADKKFVNCTCCNRENCPNRRAPYDPHFAVEVKSLNC